MVPRTCSNDWCSHVVAGLPFHVGTDELVPVRLRDVVSRRLLSGDCRALTDWRFDLEPDYTVVTTGLSFLQFTSPPMMILAPLKDASALPSDAMW